MLSPITVLLPLALALSSFGSPALAVSVPGQGTWETTLQGRDIDRNPVASTAAAAVYLYDSAAGLTWLRNANANGERNWSAARQWAADLVVGSGGLQVDDWRLPHMQAADIANCEFAFAATACGYNVDSRSSEMAALYQLTLGNSSRFDEAGNERLVGAGLGNDGPFVNLQAAGYWLADETEAGVAWRFDTFDGVQDVTFQQLPFFAMAVRNGDVLAVPEPHAAGLLLAGLLGLRLVVVRRRAQAAGAAC